MDGTVTVAFRTTPLCRDVLVMHGEAGSVVVAGREREPLPMGLAPPTWAAHLTSICCPERTHGGGSCRNAEEGVTGRPAGLTLEKEVHEVLVCV